MNSQTVGFRLPRGFAVLGAFALFGGALLASPAHAQDSGKPVTLNLQNAPVVLVLKNLFKSAGKNFTIDQNVSGPVTVDLNNVPFDTALNAVLQGAYPPLQAPEDTPGVYHVELASATQTTAPPTNVTQPVQTTPVSTEADPKHPYPIRIKTYDAYEMALLIAAFSQKTVTYVDPTGGQYSASGGSQGGGGQSGRGGQGGIGGGQSGRSGFGGSSGGFGGGGSSFGGGGSSFGGGGFR